MVLSSRIFPVDLQILRPAAAQKLDPKIICFKIEEKSQDQEKQVAFSNQVSGISR